ncbi:MAG: hypothetical protein EZS28_012832, partial [Streblomastix strix]
VGDCGSGYSRPDGSWIVQRDGFVDQENDQEKEKEYGKRKQKETFNVFSMYLETKPVLSQIGNQQSAYIDYEEILRQLDLVPIRPLGSGAFGTVYEVYDRQYGIVAVKIIKKEKFDI